MRKIEKRFIEGIIAEPKKHDNVAFYEPMNEPHQWIDFMKPGGPGIYYGNRYWAVGSGNASPGTYSVSSDTLTVTLTYMEVDYTEETTSRYTIKIDGNTLAMTSLESGRTEIFTKEKSCRVKQLMISIAFTMNKKTSFRRTRFFGVPEGI